LVCPSCNSSVDSSEIFCEECGYQLKNSSTVVLPNISLPTPERYTEETIFQKRIPAPVKSPAQKEVLILPNGFLLKERYRLTFYAAGGMATIYQAIDVMTDIKYIIKEAYSPDIEEKEIMTMALLKERDTLAGLDHPGIVKAVDLFQYMGTYYLVLEYVQGINLDNYAGRMTSLIDERDVLRWSIQLCSTLDYLHSMSPPIIYRDLKPENIIVDVFGRVKLIDFGIARSFKEDKSRDTVAIGTPGFASPEQYGRKQTDERSDIYSLGATMHYFLTGSDPRKRENPFLFPPVSSLNMRVTPRTREIVERAVQVKRDDRYQSVKEMRQDLEYSLEKLEAGALMVREGSTDMAYSSRGGEIHPGVLSFVLPIITSFITVFSLAALPPPIYAVVPFIIGISFLAGTILGFKGIIRDIKRQSYGMLIISILGTSINLLPTMIMGLILVAIIIVTFL